MTPWTLPADADSEARRYLAASGLRPGRYLACFPTGAIPEKRWPQARFVEVIRAVRLEFDLDVLLLGSVNDEKLLAEFGGALPDARVYVGGPGDLPLLAGLLSHCRTWLGNDTGPAHLAQAYSRPGVAVFSEGVNHVYAPWGPGAIGLFHPLPCSGCLWDCAFGHGVCIESIPVDGVRRALRDALTSPPATPETRNFSLVDPAMSRLMGEASARYVESQRDRRRRFDVLIQVAHGSQGFWPRLSRWLEAAAGRFRP
jgi:ADP-heptose:LPS heptosyltransferase